MITSLIGYLCVGGRGTVACEYKLNGTETAIMLLAAAIVAWFVATSVSGNRGRHRSRFGKKLQKVDLTDARRSRERRRWWRRRDL